MLVYIYYTHTLTYMTELDRIYTYEYYRIYSSSILIIKETKKGEINPPNSNNYLKRLVVQDLLLLTQLSMNAFASSDMLMT